MSRAAPVIARPWAVLVAVALVLVGCGDQRGAVEDAAAPSSPPPVAVGSAGPGTPDVADPVVMPDLTGLPSAVAGRRLGKLEARARLGLSSAWGEPVTVRCGTRPGTVVRQHPPPGTPLAERVVVHVRTAAIDLEGFRGPCEPADGDLGPVTGADAVLARRFYRFAADPSLGAPFAQEDTWVGIEAGPTSVRLGPEDRADLSAWELHATYAESSGPFSALDLVAGSGGYYELHRGVVATCPSGDDRAPAELADLRAITLTAPTDTVAACMEWWGVTLFLDADDQIRGVALRHGAP